MLAAPIPFAEGNTPFLFNDFEREADSLLFD